MLEGETDADGGAGSSRDVDGLQHQCRNIDLLFFDPTAYSKTTSKVRQAPSMFDSVIGTAEGGASGRTKLPMNAERIALKGREEIHVPPMRGMSAGGGAGGEDGLVPISAIPGFARSCFKGYKSLNLIQSKLYDTAMYKDENVLVCAPTGA